MRATSAAFVGIATMSYIFPSINFSRMIVGLSSVAMAIIALITRNLINYRRTGNFFFTEETKKRVVIVGLDEEVARIARVIRAELDYPVTIEGTVRFGESREDMPADCLGTHSQLGEIVNIFKIDEVIFANKGVSTAEILDLMSSLSLPTLRFKIVPPDTDYLVGPNIIHTSLSSRPVNFSLDSPELKFKKRLFDIGGSLGLLLLFPLTFWCYPRPARAVGNLWHALTGRYHLVGYIRSGTKGLPKIKEGILNMLHRVKGGPTTGEEHSARLDQHYARSYSPELDLEILVKGLRSLGRVKKG
jgi:hypothetical protein